MLAVPADHVIFGHTHWSGSPKAENQPKLWNTGSWVHSAGLLGRNASESPYWPGTICFVEDEGEPQLHGLLDELTRKELAGAGD